MGISLGTWALSNPPFENAVQAAVQAEADGFDWITYWDPASLFTPEFAPGRRDAAGHGRVPRPGGEHRRCRARGTRAEVRHGVLDSVRRHPAVLAQTMLTLDHATQGRTITALSSIRRWEQSLAKPEVTSVTSAQRARLRARTLPPREES